MYAGGGGVLGCPREPCILVHPRLPLYRAFGCGFYNNKIIINDPNLNKILAPVQPIVKLMRQKL